MDLLKNRKTNTTGSQQVVAVYANSSTAPLTLIASGTFDGATVGVEVSAHGKNSWVKLDDANLIEGSPPVALISRGYDIRGYLDSAGASTELTLTLE